MVRIFKKILLTDKTAFYGGCFERSLKQNLNLRPSFVVLCVFPSVLFLYLAFLLSRSRVLNGVLFLILTVSLSGSVSLAQCLSFFLGGGGGE